MPFRRIISFFILSFLIILMTSCDSNNPSSSSTGPEDTESYNTRTAQVTYVYDGDTIQVNGSERVRYIGIDTPEQGDCYYWEATLRNRELIDDRTVLLEICPSSPTDQYGRTLAHVKLNDTLINAVLIQEGYARAYRVSPCTTRADYYSQLESEAKKAGRGMWSECE